MDRQTMSSLISLVVALIVIVATYFKWFEVSWNGQPLLRPWVRYGLLPVCAVGLFAAIVLLLAGQ